MNFFFPVTNPFKNLGCKGIVLKILDHFAKVGEIRQRLSDPLSVLPTCS